eukprot:9106888-Heterocapsa_arctica.AAC.1
MENSTQRNTLWDNSSPPKIREMNRMNIMRKIPQLTRYWLKKMKGSSCSKQREEVLETMRMKSIPEFPVRKELNLEPNNSSLRRGPL